MFMRNIKKLKHLIVGARRALMGANTEEGRGEAPPGHSGAGVEIGTTFIPAEDKGRHTKNKWFF